MYKKEDIFFPGIAVELTVKARSHKIFLWSNKGLKKYPPTKMTEYWEKRFDKDEASKNFISSVWKEWLEKQGYKDKHDLFTRNHIPDPKNYPKFTQMAVSFASSLVEWTKKGFKVVNEQQFNERLDICKGCDLFDSKAINGLGRCTACGCATQAKLRIATEKCPKDKWLSVIN